MRDSGPAQLKPLAGVIGAADATADVLAQAEATGELLARHGYGIVCGGRTGVMAAAARGAAQAGGLVVGVLPGPHADEANEFVTVAIPTNMGHARNAIIVHSARFLVAIAGEAGTLSEIALGLKLGKSVYGLGTWRIKGVIPVADVEELALTLAEDGWLGKPSPL
jgi:uncharacterized protein (TIGR00725 family)